VHCPNFFQENKTVSTASKRHANNHFSKAEFDAWVQFNSIRLNSSHSFGAAKEAVYVHDFTAADQFFARIITTISLFIMLFGDVRKI
jgi:hypothetical protein